VHVSQTVLNQAAKDVDRYLFNQDVRERVVSHNFELGKKHYGLDTLRAILEQITTRNEL
jgi:hypothetical protein